ncbi:hypothetical protein J2Y69_001118 [Microbacterium resistens]|uniref:Uncharacterized protein n=1 Tax=Microbacterium resistens TaxID=156977 RepID=A0ABU1SA96_9MICO|nr:hypothetical protein [Microbacterium resistens]MDR6866525.1 hypothetical protein [Microbacterium resistens]
MSAAHENLSTTAGGLPSSARTSGGISRRTIVTGAAWSVPLIAVAVSVPRAAASDVTSPTALVTGAIQAGVTSSTRYAQYGGGQVTFASAGVAGIDSGRLSVSISNLTSTKFQLITLESVVAEYEAAGWTLVVATEALIEFTHAPIVDGGTVLTPAIRWEGALDSGKPRVGIAVSSDSDDVIGTIISTN